MGYNFGTMRYVILPNRYGLMPMCNLPRLVETEAPPALVGSTWA
jgi:hypothetical protein